MVLIPDSTQSWMRCRKGCLSPRGGGSCWELRAFAGSLPGSNCCGGGSFSLPLPAQSERELLLQTFPKSSFWKNLPTKGRFPSVVACVLPCNAGQSLWLFLSGAEEISESSCLKELCWRAESTRKTIKPLPASPLLVGHFDFRRKLPSFPHGAAT